MISMIAEKCIRKTWIVSPPEGQQFHNAVCFAVYGFCDKDVVEPFFLPIEAFCPHVYPIFGDLLK